MTLPCREHWQVLVTQLLGGALIEFQIIKKSVRFVNFDLFGRVSRLEKLGVVERSVRFSAIVHP